MVLVSPSLTAHIVTCNTVTCNTVTVTSRLRDTGGERKKPSHVTRLLVSRVTSHHRDNLQRDIVTRRQGASSD